MLLNLISFKHSWHDLCAITTWYHIRHMNCEYLLNPKSCQIRQIYSSESQEVGFCSYFIKWLQKIVLHQSLEILKYKLSRQWYQSLLIMDNLWSTKQVYAALSPSLLFAMQVATDISWASGNLHVVWWLRSDLLYSCYHSPTTMKGVLRVA